MGFVVIAEPEEVNAARIRTILDSVDKSFEYELVSTAEAALDIMEIKKADVFIGAMQMAVMTGAELFAMVEMMFPETVRIVMTDAGKINETVAFMNECKTYKVIMKPCRVADDLLTPINAALAYKEKREHTSKEKQEIDTGMAVTGREYREKDDTWRRNIQNFQQTQNLFGRILACNVQLSDYGPKTKARLERWYQWMMDEYTVQILANSWDYDSAAKMLTSFCHDPENGCIFQMKKTPEEIEPECMNVITYILRLVTGVCRDLQLTYHISVRIETVEKVHILRVRYKMDRDENGKEDISAQRVRSEELREALTKATRIGIEAFGFKAVVLNKEQEDILNIAIPRLL